MSHFVIEGGRPLRGSVRPSGNKNEALPVLIAAILTDETVVLKRMPRIQDILTLGEVLIKLGVEVEWTGPEELTVCAKKLNSHRADPELCAKIRASILLLGGILAREQKIELPLPGGDVIGARRIDSHFEGIEALGGQLTLRNGAIHGTLNPKPGTVLLDEPSVTATENLLYIAATTPGVTTLVNVASEPHVVGLSKMLVAMGARIEGLGSNRLTVHGTSTLKGVTHTIGPDFMEVGSFLCIGAMAEGSITLEDVSFDDLPFILKGFYKLGMEPEKIGSNSMRMTGQNLKMRTDIGGRIASIASGPWPAFPTDLMSMAIVTATQAQGTMLFHEKMFEGRMFFTDKLLAMGANIVLCDPHRVVVTGPARLSGAQVSSPDVRAGMAVLSAALVAKGKSEIHSIYQIERGYEKIEEKLASLGAAITRVG